MHSPKLIIRGGAVLFHRLGPLEYGEQSRWSHAPEKKGLWAFPYPFYDTFFTWHKYEDALPKSLKQNRKTWLPLDPKWCYSTDPEIDVVITREFLEGIADNFVDDPNEDYRSRAIWPDWLGVKEEFHKAREKWIRDVGRKIVPMHKFWYSGELYAHFAPNGQVMGSNDWTLQHTSTLVKNIASNGGNVSNWQGKLVRTSVDHLEVFIPRGNGRISGRITEKFPQR